MNTVADAVTLNRFNRLPPADAAMRMLRCCGSDAWAERMVAGRPYDSLGALLDAAERRWRALPVEAHLQAFAAHPEIGDATAAGDAREEQAGAAEASNATRAELARLNRDYRQKFGFVFLICARGLSADAMLAELRARIIGSRESELANAAEEQRKITRLRLQKMFAAESATATSATVAAATTVAAAAPAPA